MGLPIAWLRGEWSGPDHGHEEGSEGPNVTPPATAVTSAGTILEDRANMSDVEITTIVDSRISEMHELMQEHLTRLRYIRNYLRRAMPSLLERRVVSEALANAQQLLEEAERFNGHLDRLRSFNSGSREALLAWSSDFQQAMEQMVTVPLHSYYDLLEYLDQNDYHMDEDEDQARSSDTTNPQARDLQPRRNAVAFPHGFEDLLDGLQSLQR